jgi:hypothetical protein
MTESVRPAAGSTEGADANAITRWAGAIDLGCGSRGTLISSLLLFGISSAPTGSARHWERS